ncbi:TPA: hypothetical protein ACLFL7_004930, partial [Salmonella enterica subsp. diarizonae serovar 53:z10:z35]
MITDYPGEPSIGEKIFIPVWFLFHKKSLTMKPPRKYHQTDRHNQASEIPSCGRPLKPCHMKDY